MLHLTWWPPFLPCTGGSQLRREGKEGAGVPVQENEGGEDMHGEGGGGVEGGTDGYCLTGRGTGVFARVFRTEGFSL